MDAKRNYSKLGNVGRDYLQKVTRCGLALEHVPRDYIDADICRAAVRQNGESIQFVPDSMLTEELIRAATLCQPLAARYVPERITIELWNELVSIDALVLEHVPLHFKTDELCRKAVEQNPMAIKHAVQTKELVDYAYVKNPKTFACINDEFKTQEMVDNLPMFDCVEKYIPEKFKTPELVKKVQQYYITKRQSMFSVPESYLTPELCKQSIIQYPQSIFGMPETARVKYVDLAINRCPKIVDRMSTKLLDCASDEVLSRPEVFLNISSEYKTETLCMLAVCKSGYSIFHVPRQLLSPELLQIAANDPDVKACMSDEWLYIIKQVNDATTN